MTLDGKSIWDEVKGSFEIPSKLAAFREASQILHITRRILAATG